jgi:hypothetical protein
MTKKQILVLSLVFTSFFIWHICEISILHKNIRKVRKEAWFDTHDISDTEIREIKYCIEHLESRINQFHGKDLDYPNGYPLWEERPKRERDPLTEYLIDQCL